MSVSAAAEMTDYKQAPEATDKLNFRVPKSLKRNVDNVKRLWIALAISRDHDTTNINQTHVCTELLQDGVQLAFKNFGGIPKNEEAWKDLEKGIREGTIATTAEKSAEVMRLEAEIEELRTQVQKLQALAKHSKK